MSTAVALDESKPGKLSVTGYLKMIFSVLQMPLYLTYEVLASPFVRRSKKKPLKRILSDALVRHSYTCMDVASLRRVQSTSVDVYKAWAKKRDLDTLIEELPFGGKLLWIGPKRMDNVVLFIHGGGFIFSLHDASVSFWRWVQVELEKKDLPVGIAIMSYSLIPAVAFPTQLQQATAAISYLLERGVQPSNLQLAGDSAGANIVSQILSHLVHPVPSIPPIVLPPNTRLRGAYMMSPWISHFCPQENHSNFDCNSSFMLNNHLDIAPGDVFHQCGTFVLQAIPDSQFMKYVEPITAPDGWYDGLENFVDRVLVTTGEWEGLRDSSVVFFEKFIKPFHRNAELVVQDRGVHDDPFYELVLAEKPFCSNTLGPRILEWAREGFEA